MELFHIQSGNTKCLHYKMGTNWFFEHLFTESNSTSSTDSSYTCELIDFQPVVCGAPETMLYPELRQTVIQTPADEKDGSRETENSRQGTVLVDRCAED